MARPRRHLRWQEPRRAPRARLARVPRPTTPDPQGPRYQWCRQAMACAVALRAQGQVVVSVSAVAGPQVSARGVAR